MWSVRACVRALRACVCCRMREHVGYVRVGEGEGDWSDKEVACRERGRQVASILSLRSLGFTLVAGG